MSDSAVPFGASRERSRSSISHLRAQRHPHRQLVRAQLANDHSLRTRTPQLLAQRSGTEQHLRPVRRIPDGLLADAELRTLRRGRKSRLGAKEADALSRIPCGCDESLRDLRERIVGGDRCSGRDPGILRLDERDTGVLAVEPVAKLRLEDLERRGVPTEPFEQRVDARALVES